MTLTWTPQSAQSGPQGFCAGAIDNYNLQSDPWCITYLVDYTSPNLIRPQLYKDQQVQLVLSLQTSRYFQ